jgi:hypothetical protein
MTQNRDRKRKIRARMGFPVTGEPYTEAARHVGQAARPPLAADSTGEHLAWSGPGWYAFPPEPPQGTGLGLGTGRNQRYYWEARRQWAPWQVRQHARMAAELTGGRARHLADWYPEGWAPYHGSTRDLALELLYVITLHDWPDLVPDPARLAARLVSFTICARTARRVKTTTIKVLTTIRALPTPQGARTCGRRAAASPRTSRSRRPRRHGSMRLPGRG